MGKKSQDGSSVLLVSTESEKKKISVSDRKSKTLNTSVDSKKANRSKSGKNSRSRDKRCEFHTEATTHYTLYCKRLNIMSGKEIKEFLQKKNMCFVCFCKHDDKGCQSKYSCAELNCKNPNSHHKLIHMACTDPSPTTGCQSARWHQCQIAEKSSVFF